MYFYIIFDDFPDFQGFKMVSLKGAKFVASAKTNELTLADPSDRHRILFVIRSSWTSKLRVPCSPFFLNLWWVKRAVLVGHVVLQTVKNQENILRPCQDQKTRFFRFSFFPLFWGVRGGFQPPGP